MKWEKIKEEIIVSIIVTPIVLIIETIGSYLRTKTNKVNMNTDFSLVSSIIESLPISILLGLFLTFIYIKVKRRIDSHDELVKKTIGNNDIIWYVLDYRTKKIMNNQPFSEEEEKKQIKKILENKFGEYFFVKEINEIIERFYKKTEK